MCRLNRLDSSSTQCVVPVFSYCPPRAARLACRHNRPQPPKILDSYMYFHITRSHVKKRRAESSRLYVCAPSLRGRIKLPYDPIGEKGPISIVDGLDCFPSEPLADHIVFKDLLSRRFGQSCIKVLSKPKSTQRVDFRHLIRSPNTEKDGPIFIFLPWFCSCCC